MNSQPFKKNSGNSRAFRSQRGKTSAFGSMDSSPRGLP
jgi:hypothetical protein